MGRITKSWRNREKRKGRREAAAAWWESSAPLKEPDKPEVIPSRVFVLCKFVTTTSRRLIGGVLHHVFAESCLSKGHKELGVVCVISVWWCFYTHTGLGRLQTVFSHESCSLPPSLLPFLLVVVWSDGSTLFSSSTDVSLDLVLCRSLPELSQQRGIKFTSTTSPHNGREEPDNLPAEMVSHWLTSLATPRVTLKDETHSSSLLYTLLFSHVALISGGGTLSLPPEQTRKFS